MTNPTPSGQPKTYRESLAFIDESIPLKVPFWGYMGHILPRMQRAETKIAFLVDYIEFLEGRIAALEERATD